MNLQLLNPYYIEQQLKKEGGERGIDTLEGSSDRQDAGGRGQGSRPNE